ncbi:hypothetical protein THAOC_15093 [Thalassiosira oceanica]|uniref:Uncharacterized protein n=1 Tax=Thalassiosira oceanica TaxID=159749 RepID=K0SGW2_THAOC|nr:hypothetical protein THAOC_15093 [Thalassiosira oceanica]|eukprot:EJK64189.1 hypothetical protein THAOC_15093 [Thalassiosira oceanica]
MIDDSSDDDMPLSSLAAKKRPRTVASYADSDDGEEEFGDQVSEASGGFVEEDEDNGITDGDYADDSDDSDDMPLSALAKEKKKNPKSAAKKKPPKSSEKKRSATKKSQSKPKSKPAKKTTKTVAKASVSAGNYVCASSELYMNSDKGKLIESILVRWYVKVVCISDGPYFCRNLTNTTLRPRWYAYTWPDPKDLPKSTPVGYDALDGFPGMYICTQGSEVGQFMDLRDKSNAPSFNNFARKSSEELRRMLLTAIENQRTALVGAEGGGSGVEVELKRLESWAKKLKCDKADKEATKVLKAQRLAIP